MKKVSKLSINFDSVLLKRKEKLRLNKEKSLEFAEKVINDLKTTRNWSWYRELIYRNFDNLDSIALFYRGNEITYGEMFNQMRKYAQSLKIMGINKGDEIPICMSNTPEFVYLLGAVSMIGAEANIFSEDFDKDYLEHILKSSGSNVFFVEDNKFSKLEDIVQKSGIDNIVMQSLGDSLPNGENPYKDFDKDHLYLFESKVDKYKSINNKVMSIKDFEKIGKDYSGEVVDNTVTLEDRFTITYSSGTTSTRPKGIRHAAKSYNGVTRFHDHEVNGTPSYKLFSMQANIPTYSSTGLISGISDALTQGCKLALEPIYDENFVVESLLINKPRYLDFTKSYWLRFAKNILYNPKYKDVKIPSLTICFSVGERTDLNEEKLINKALKKVHAGRDLLPLPFPIIKLSAAGGDCEHGGIFYKLLRSYYNLNPLHMVRREPAGLETFDAVDVAVLDSEGNHCPPYTVGNLVANSYFNMLEYKDNEDATKKFFVYDSDGKQYGDCTATAYMDYFGDIHFKERSVAGHTSTSEINSSILRNLSCILSSEVVEVDGYYVAHVEFIPEKTHILENLLQIENRCNKELGHEITSKIIYRIHDFHNSFDLTHSGKRDLLLLNKEKIKKDCIKPVYQDGVFKIKNANDYILSMNTDCKEKMIVKQ